ncbi:DUF1475 family protein [Panacagrimonas sp.]|uniref:DUF1475 family protein n=1 Tax=Panacagrimonas sp. TaxID=2480088 RepID=UPI003B5298AD
MKPGLMVFSLAALLSLIGISVWATGHISIVPAIQDLLQRPSEGYTPWLVATLIDAYFGFLWFWLWIAYKETSWASRTIWLLLVLLTGNMAMAVYMLIQLWKLPPNPTAQDLLLRRA